MSVSGKELKNVNLTIRVTPSELDQIRLFAKERGVPYSDFCMSAIKQAMGVASSQDELIQSLIIRVGLLESKLEKLESVEQQAA